MPSFIEKLKKAIACIREAFKDDSPGGKKSAVASSPSSPSSPTAPASAAGGTVGSLKDRLGSFTGRKDSLMGPKGTPMKFPYTMTAKIVQFPWRYYVKNNWVYRYYIFGLIVTYPVFVKIHNLSNSPANVEKWKEIKRKEDEEEHH